MGKVMKKNGSNKEKNRSSEKDYLLTDKNYKSMDWYWRNPLSKIIMFMQDVFLGHERR